MVANSISRISPEFQTNKEKTAGLLDVILELRSSKLTSFELKIMILAGSQSKERGPLQPVTQFPSDICTILSLVLVLVAISRPYNMQLHELILTQILIC